MKRKFALGAAVGAICAVLFATAAAWFASRVDERMQEQECELLFEQVRRAAVSCYASEGRYPQELGYLEDHYGLIYDADRYSILYDAFASNIMPDIAVNIRGEDE